MNQYILNNIGAFEMTGVIMRIISFTLVSWLGPFHLSPKIVYLQTLDFFLTLLHLVIIGFNLLGWIWASTRKLHFYLVIATLFCWTVLGFWFGFGYCLVTDWQWQVKTKLGEQDLPNSFIKYFADEVTGMDISSVLIDWITAVSFGLVVVVSCTLYVIRYTSGRRADLGGF